MSEPRILLFLVLKNKRINSLLHILRKIFNGKDNNSDIHITVRGPFKGKIKTELIENIKNEMLYDVIKIEGVGAFKNGDQNFVFLKIDSPNLENIWNKPGFPKSKHGFNPHITLYKGTNSDRADKILSFLKAEEIRLLCEEFEFMSYDLLQRSIPEEQDLVDSFMGLEISGNIKKGLIERANNLLGNENETK